MKKTKILMTIVALALVGGCSSEEEEQTATYEEKIAEVCDCFKEKQTSGDTPQECFMLQGELSKSVGEEKKQDFINQTNACAN